MKVFYHINEVKNIKNPVVTTGTFDGVHIGHKTIINRLNKLAGEIDGESVLITFYPHPRKVLYPQSEGKELLMINSQKEKIILLEKAGLKNLIIHPFSIEFSQTSSTDFILEYLVKQLKSRKVVVGFNHHFGHNKEGDYSYLYKLGKLYGFEVEEISEIDIQNETVSSTKIRKAILDGDIQKANAYLDQYYFIHGELKLGSSIFNKMGFNTFSLTIDEEEKLIPPDGIYAISAKFTGKYSKGMAIISSRNTSSILQILFFGNTPEIDTTGEVYFHKRFRGELDFTNPDVLKNVIQTDWNAIMDLIY